MKWRTMSSTISFVIISMMCLLGTEAEAQTLDQAVGELAEQIGSQLQDKGKSKIAIVEFTNLSKQITLLGRLISEELTGQLLSQGGREFRMVERIKVEDIFGEAGRAGQGQIEGGGAAAVAALGGVDAILAGSVAELGSRIRINARLMAFPSGELITAAAAYMGMDGIDPSVLKPVGETAGKAEVNGGTIPMAKMDIQGILFELLECKEAPREIVCEFVLTNNLADREVKFLVNNYTFLYDQRGYQFLATHIRVADRESYRELIIRLISELPTPLTLTFAGVPSAIDFIKVLHMWVGGRTFEFRDIALSE